MDRVVFRKYRNGELVALFPDQSADSAGQLCVCYLHVGQHGQADYHHVISTTRPATTAEAAPLADELTKIGYALKSIKRVSHRTHQRRREFSQV